MANIMQNRIDAVMKGEDMLKLKETISAIIKMLPKSGLLTLNDDERASLTSLDVDNKAFVEDAIHEMRNNGAGILPAFITADQVQSDLTLFEQMDELLSLLAKARQAMSDLLRIAATEAFGVSNAAYQFFKSAAEAGIPGAQSSYDKLKVRYKNQGKSGGSGAPLKEE